MKEFEYLVELNKDDYAHKFKKSSFEDFQSELKKLKTSKESLFKITHMK